MFLRLVRHSFLRRKRRKAVLLAAVALGTSAAAALADIALDIGDKMSRELNSFGANLVVLPAGGGAPVLVGGEDVAALRLPSYLDAAALTAIRENFWKNNILGLAPVLDVPARLARGGPEAGGGRAVLLRGTWFERGVPGTDPPLVTGARSLNPYWSIEGTSPSRAIPRARSRRWRGTVWQRRSVCDRATGWRSWSPGAPRFSRSPGSCGEAARRTAPSCCRSRRSGACRDEAGACRASSSGP